MFKRLNRRMLMRWMEAFYSDLLVIPVNMIGAVMGPLLGTILGTIVGGKVGKAVGFKLSELTDDHYIHRTRGPYGDARRGNRRVSARVSAAMGVTTGSAMGAALGAMVGSSVGEMLGDVADELLWSACTWLVDVVTIAQKKEPNMFPEVHYFVDDHLYHLLLT